MSSETIGKFLSKPYEKTGGNQLPYFDKYKIGQEAGLLDKTQTDHIVEILVKDGFVTDNGGDSKITITEQGNKRISNNQM